MHSTVANRSMPQSEPLGNRASAGLARFASRGGAAADPFGAPPAADTEVIQRRGNNAPAPVPAAAPMDRKGR